MLYFVLQVLVESDFIPGELYFIVEGDVIELVGPGVVVVGVEGLV